MAASSSAASVVDLATLFTLLHLLHLWPGAAGALGCMAGGAVNFALNRRWVFGDLQRQHGAHWRGQLLRYALLVVLGGALGSGLVIQLTVAGLGLPVIVAKAIAAALVLACWNYPVSARLVFNARGKGA
jgi:putative flippase GtrA